MLLRRITHHVKDQNWFAVSIDFIIVVVGVFIGIQVANWNDQRADIERGNAYLERLKLDLLADVENIELRLEFFTEVIDHGETALAYAESKDVDRTADWDTVLAFFQASQIFTYTRNDATYDEMRSAGELSLLKNQALRSDLADYYITAAESQNTVYSYLPEYRQTVRGLTPSIVSKHIWANCHASQERFGNQVLLDCDSPINEGQAKEILDGYLENPELLEQLRFWMSTMITTQGLFVIALQEAERLNSLVSANIEK